MNVLSRISQISDIFKHCPDVVHKYSRHWSRESMFKSHLYNYDIGINIPASCTLKQTLIVQPKYDVFKHIYQGYSTGVPLWNSGFLVRSAKSPL